MNRSTWIHFSMGEGKLHALSLLSHGGNLQEAFGFAEILSRYSCVKVDRVSVSQEQTVDFGDFKQGAHDNIGFYARLKFRESVSEKVFPLDIYAPSDDVYDENGDVLPEIGERIAEAYSAYTGLSLTFVEGAVCGRSL